MFRPTCFSYPGKSELEFKALFTNFNFFGFNMIDYCARGHPRWSIMTNSRNHAVLINRFAQIFMNPFGKDTSSLPREQSERKIYRTPFSFFRQDTISTDDAHGNSQSRQFPLNYIFCRAKRAWLEMRNGGRLCGAHERRNRLRRKA